MQAHDSIRCAAVEVGIAQMASVVVRLIPAGYFVFDGESAWLAQGGAASPIVKARPHDLLSVTGGSIGFSIPAGAGAAIACPDRKVITYVSDGSGLYTLQGLWTQAPESLDVLDVLTVVLANRAYAILLAELRNLGVNEVGRNAARMMSLTDPAPDWVKLPEGMGVEAVSARGCDEFSDMLVSALRRRGPFLIECLI